MLDRYYTLIPTLPKAMMRDGMADKQLNMSTLVPLAREWPPAWPAVVERVRERKYVTGKNNLILFTLLSRDFDSDSRGGHSKANGMGMEPGRVNSYDIMEEKFIYFNFAITVMSKVIAERKIANLYVSDFLVGIEHYGWN